jgi:hypothetical protein
MKSPLPVRFRPDEDQFLRQATLATGIPTLEIIRRSVRFLKRQHDLVRSYAFIADLGE